MAILGTELTSRLSGGGDIKPTPHDREYRHHPASLTGNGLDSTDPLPSELDTNGEPLLTSNLSGGEKLNPNSSILDTDFEPSLTSNRSGGEKLNKATSNLDIDINPVKYVDNLPR